MKRDSNSNSNKPSLLPELLMVGRKDAAAIASVSVATWDRMNASGKTPAPIQLSRGCVRWRLDDLRLWVSLGCPDRKAFVSQKSESIR